MASSLEQPVELCFETVGHIQQHCQHMNEHVGNNIEQLCQTCFYPDEWVDDGNKYNQAGLPPIQ